MEITFDREYVYQTIREIMDIDSPSGFAARAIDYVERWASDLGLEFSRTNKGNGVVSMKGEDTSRTVGLCAHMDTLGLMVRSIKENDWPSPEWEAPSFPHWTVSCAGCIPAREKSMREPSFP